MRMILLRANDKLKVIFHKIIKTMGENVQWNELFIINNNDLILLGALRSLFFNFDNRRAYSYILDITVNEEEAEQIIENEMLENALNMTLYTFGKWGSIKGLKVEKDYGQLNHLLEYILKEISVEASLTKENLRFYKSGIQMTYEEVIQMIIDDKKPIEEERKKEEKDSSPKEEEEEHSLGLWHKVLWQSKKHTFEKEAITEVEKAKSRLGNQFYMVNYRCPKCMEKLYMVVYPKGEEFRIETAQEGVYLARAYTCNQCNSFYTPRPQKLLADGDVYLLDFEEDKVAYEDYQELLGKRGQRISNSNFNQYESDYLKKEENENPSIYADFEDYEAMTQEELDALLEKLESGFYSDEIVEKYKEAIVREIEKRKAKDRKTGELKDRKRGESKESDFTESKKSRIDLEKKENGKNHLFMKEKGESKDHIESKDLIESKKVTVQKTREKDDNKEQIIKDRQIEGNVSIRSIDVFGQLKELLKKGKEQDFEKEIQKLTKLQLKEFKAKVHIENGLDEKAKETFLQAIDRRLNKEAEDEIQKKVVECKDKTYSYIETAIEDVKKAKIEQNEKKSILDSLSHLLEQSGKKELESIISKAPSNLTKKQYQQFRDKIDEYQGMDTRLYKKLLDEKWDESQKQEIASFMKQFNKRDRKSYQEAYERLKSFDYEERNVSPTLEKLHKKIYDMDVSAIRRICREPADLFFEEGREVYEQILLGEYLPELKDDILGQIDKRLTKLKMDECEQLVNKLMKSLGIFINEEARIYFYNARKMLRTNYEDEETIMIQNAIKSYGNEKDKYEYPLLICDTSYARNGESGFILTPNHIFYHSLLSGGKIDIMQIEEIYAQKRILNQGIFVETKNKTIKISNSLQSKDLESIGSALNDFVAYLKEKPESRSISYMAKEVHKVKCCYRCGYVYQDGNICPKCGSKMNE